MSSLPRELADLPMNMVEEVLSRVPLTSLRKVRSTCKKWNTLSKDRRFAKKHLVHQAKVTAEAKEFTLVMMMDFRVYLVRVNLHNNNKSCINLEGEVIILDDDSDQIHVSQVFQCDDLLLCISKDNTRLVVCNPFWGKTLYIEPTHNFHKLDYYTYAFGYAKSSKSCRRKYKILRFIDFYRSTFVEYKIYNLNSDSWKVLDVTPDWTINYNSRGVSLKGNTYWFAKDKAPSGRGDNCYYFLLCFDFTRERFGPRLPLPETYPEENLTLSSVRGDREEQLAVLFQRWDTLQMEIWVTTKIEPNTVSWSSKVFLSGNIKQLIHPRFDFPVLESSFFIDVEKKVFVVFDKVKKGLMNPCRNVAYIVGVDGSLKEVDLGESAYEFCYPTLCSYVPSTVQLDYIIKACRVGL